MAKQQLHDGNAEGVNVAQGTSDIVSFYGVTGTSQRASSTQATSIVSASTYTSSHHATLLEIMNTLAAAGLWKGGA